MQVNRRKFANKPISRIGISVKLERCYACELVEFRAILPYAYDYRMIGRRIHNPRWLTSREITNALTVMRVNHDVKSICFAHHV
jgi:hypothetical protein